MSQPATSQSVNPAHIERVKSRFIAWMRTQDAGAQFFEGNEADGPLRNGVSEGIQVGWIMDGDQCKLAFAYNGSGEFGNRHFIDNASRQEAFAELANGFVLDLERKIKAENPDAAIVTDGRDYGWARHLEEGELADYPADEIFQDATGRPIVFLSGMEDMDEMTFYGESAITAPEKLLLAALTEQMDHSKLSNHPELRRKDGRTLLESLAASKGATCQV
jgi:hypothetical protein